MSETVTRPAPRTTGFFCVAVEGATTDGRVIERAWLEQMAKNYNRQTYTARVNMEHIRGYSADKPFCAYGDVAALKTGEVELQLAGKTEKRLGLFAQVEATDELVAVNARGQKLFSSIEVNPTFAGTNEAYLMGLAVTDSPASIGTEMLTFAREHPDVLAGKKQAAGNLFTAAAETKIELEPQAQPSFGQQLLDFFKTTFGTSGQGPGASPSPAPAGGASGATQVAPGPGATAPAGGGAFTVDNDGKVDLAAFQAAIAQFAAQAEAQSASAAREAEFAQLRKDFAALQAKVETTPAPGFSRTPATGGTGAVLTDC